MGIDSTTAAESTDTLLAEVADDTWGKVSVSCYETGRLVALAPWLVGHDARVDYLCRQQAQDGSWGGRDGYQIVPTLSATSALVSELHRSTGRGHRKRLARAVVRGVAALHRLFTHDAPVPDTIGVELIVPALVGELDAALSRADRDPYLVDLPRTRPALHMPRGFDPSLLEKARARLNQRNLPQRAWAGLEVFGKAAVAAPTVRPAGGAVGCSAAATAAWLGGSSGDRDALGFLEALQERYDGPVPGVTPITYFEAAWVLNSVALGGLTPRVPTTVLRRLEDGLTPDGVPAAPGLPPDSDDTAAVLLALMRHGRVHRPESLLGFRTDGYFKCFLDERNPSVSANAHVLEAFALYMTHRPDDRTWFAGAAAMTAAWLLDQQRADGSWWDKWHASPYYATMCVIEALLLHDAARARHAIDRAVCWILDTQRPDGSWGRWTGTVEETAYCVQMLTKAARQDAAGKAIAWGWSYLTDSAATAEHPALWHAKDLYAPTAVIHAAALAAIRLGRPAEVPSQRRPVESGQSLSRGRLLG